VKCFDLRSAGWRLCTTYVNGPDGLTARQEERKTCGREVESEYDFGRSINAGPGQPLEILRKVWMTCKILLRSCESLTRITTVFQDIHNFTLATIYLFKTQQSRLSLARKIKCTYLKSGIKVASLVYH
jgi:hypothetical protein